MTKGEELAALPLKERIARVVDDAQTDQDTFADAVGAQRETVNRWINGWARPGRSFRQRLADYASRLYGERVSPDVFSDRAAPAEAEAQLAQTTRALQETAGTLTQLLGELMPLLRQQAALVADLQRLVTELRRRSTANGQA